jgi:hypothetical protein
MKNEYGEVDVRWKQRFQNYQKALVQLQSAISLSHQRELIEHIRRIGRPFYVRSDTAAASV